MTLPTFENVPQLSKRALFNSLAILRDLKIKTYYGKPILSAALEYSYGMAGSEIRSIISHHRCAGEPIGSSGKGYFYCQRPFELDTTIQHIEGRLHKLSVVRSGLIKAREDLVAAQGDLFAKKTHEKETVE